MEIVKFNVQDKADIILEQEKDIIEYLDNLNLMYTLLEKPMSNTIRIFDSRVEFIFGFGPEFYFRIGITNIDIEEQKTLSVRIKKGYHGFTARKVTHLFKKKSLNWGMKVDAKGYYYYYDFYFNDFNVLLLDEIIKDLELYF